MRAHRRFLSQGSRRPRRTEARCSRDGGEGPSATGGGSDGGLRALLRALDGAPYGRYRQILGRHALGEFLAIVDHVPTDPFAGMARIRLAVDRAKAALPPALVGTTARRIGAEDFLSRTARTAVAQHGLAGAASAPGTGRVVLDELGPCMLERSVCRVTEEQVELRLLVDLPASSRRIRGLQAETLFFSSLVRLATATLLFSSRRVEEAWRSAGLSEDHAHLQSELEERGLVAFVADGSLLARVSGTDDELRRDGREVPFVSPDSLAVTVELPNAGQIRGMGIPAGVTLIVGGAFHGKSTLLRALASAVHPHHPGDGRERVATHPEAVVVRAEDGRSIRRVDIGGFFTDLPSGEIAADFSTDHASGSTSQAAAVCEALEAGSRVLLVDEDTSTMNFLVRDGRMQRLLPRPREPIVPLLDRLRDLYDGLGVSTILATGGAGDYFESADTVILMENYRAAEVTSSAREIIAKTRTARIRERIPPMRAPMPREPFVEQGDEPRPRRIGLRGPRALRVGDDVVDVAGLVQIREMSQVRALAYLLDVAREHMGPGKDLRSVLREIEQLLDRAGLDGLDRPAAFDLARPRRLDVAGAINRWRSLRVRRPDR